VVLFTAQNTVNIPAGLSIPPGSILMKNDQGQLMLVPGGSQVNSPVRQVLQVQFCYVRVLKLNSYQSIFVRACLQFLPGLE